MDFFTPFVVLFFVSLLKNHKKTRKSVNWKPLFMTNLKIEGFEHIFISPIVKEDGNPWIWNSKSGRWLSSRKCSSGYWVITFGFGKKRNKAFRANRLLSKTFIPNSDPEKTIVDHINRKRWDNTLSNLRWITPKENNENRSKVKKMERVEQNVETELFQIPVSYITGKETNWHMNTEEMSHYYISKEGNLRGKKGFNSGNKTEDGYIRHSFKIEGNPYRVYLHVLLARMFIENPNPEIYIEVDHIKGKSNSLSNLRWVTRSLNKKNKESQTYGICLYRGRWLSRVVSREGNQIFLGHFVSKETAMRIHDKEEYKIYGSDSKLNFPYDLETSLALETPKIIRRKVTKHHGSIIGSEGNFRGLFCFKGEKFRFGPFGTREEALRACDKKALELLGYERAKKRLNFPSEYNG
jgi:HNH endonuclease